MKTNNIKVPSPKEIEKEIGEFLAKKFGGTVKIVPPIMMHDLDFDNKIEEPPKKVKKINFDLKPEELVAYLDQYIAKQDDAKAILSTKICTHFNRIKYSEEASDIVGQIKNNIIMIGPTGVGKTYMVKLIAKKIGVPFVKADATKFSETGYVGGDVEDLIRELVREADGDIQAAQYGIIYLDEIDKIASSRNLIGSDISRTGVQRALLKPMEETDVDLKVPHDPISMFQEIERFRKTGERDKRTVNTKNILFIMSGAFVDIHKIIKDRLSKQKIGFGAQIQTYQDTTEFLKFIKTEDLVEFGFESEFVGRLPVRTVFERLSEKDLYDILVNPNNPIILSKKIDFSSYGINIKFDDNALSLLAKKAYSENTGARGLVSTIESALILFEKTLPSTNVKKFFVDASMISSPKEVLQELLKAYDTKEYLSRYNELALREKISVKKHIYSNKHLYAERFKLNLTPQRIDSVVNYYCDNITDIEKAFRKIKFYYDESKRMEEVFLSQFDLDIYFDDDTIDFLIEQFINNLMNFESIYKKISDKFVLGLRLISDKTNKNSFLITKEAFINPDEFLNQLIKQELSDKELRDKEEKNDRDI
ncbi:MAG: AAA family ATPase [Desulfobacterales bacterium]|nr:AAA family ATPase [Desulfobacterales bacterium]